MAKKKTNNANVCGCDYVGKKFFCVGIALLIAAVMMYLGYSWMQIFAVLGVLAILKGIYYMKK